MKLYHLLLSTYSMKTRLAFYEKGVDVELVPVSLLDPEAREAYVNDIYPIGKVPLLELDDGYRIPESTIIIEYLETHFGSGTSLIPDDPDLARRARYFDRMADFYLNNSVTTIWFEGQKPEGERDQAGIDRSERYVKLMYSYLAKEIGDGPWLLGETFSLGDVAAFPPLFYLSNLRPFHEHQELHAYFERLMQRPAVQRVVAEVTPALAAMAK